VPAPGGDDDFANQINSMKTGAGGTRIHQYMPAAVGGVALGVLGFFLGGPIGAIVGALVGAAAGYVISKHVFQ
ncbi:MAG: hypothetical protein HY079_05080, partial [Elusimicrobia bacterium]|nr:hypothetical protein [Elusimicrobiota bacterium]